MVCSLIKHPKYGYMLFDVGYSDNFFKASDHFPYRFYKMATPVTIDKTLAELLRRDDIDPADIKYVFISHFHADHISAIDDFPNATIITSHAAYNYSKKLTGFKAVRKGILPQLMALFTARKFQFVEDKKKIKGHKKLYDFMTHDIFGDGAVVATSLPGHARGQHGLYLEDTNKKKIFLVADATWLLPSLAADSLPLPIVAMVSDDHRQYKTTFHQLHDFYHKNRDVQLIPCHCQATFDSMTKK